MNLGNANFAPGVDAAAMIGSLREQLLNPIAQPLRKSNSVSTSTGLVNYDLQKPAKNLYPVNTPLRNRLPRVQGNGDIATRWKVVSAIGNGSGGAMGWVPEGGRAGVMSVTATNKLSSYATFGTEINLTFEAWSAAEGFEDEKARNAIRNLQQTMLLEETALLGGNTSVPLGIPGTVVVTVASTGGLIASGTYKVTVVALTFEGYQNWLNKGSLIATGLPVSVTVTDPTGASFTINGGSSDKSATTTAGTAITGTGVINASVPAVAGAVAYGWYVDDGASGANTSTLQTVTLLNSVKLTKALTTSGQNLTAITGDHSTNPGAGSGPAAFDGIMYATYASASGLQTGNNQAYLPGAYLNNLPTGTAGTGTKLTASGKGTVVEIDNMLIAMWNQYQVSPSIIWVNAQQLQDITTLCLNGSSGPLLQYFADANTGYQKLMAGGVIEFYFNPFTQGGGTKIPVMIHPTLPPGVIVAYAENLPMQYQSPEVPNTAEVHLRRDYYQIDWPARTRLYESGIYAEETLAVYAPFATGIIGNVAPGTA